MDVETTEHNRNIHVWSGISSSKNGHWLGSQIQIQNANARGIPINGPVVLLGDNKSAVTSTSVATSVLKKKHNAIAYHRVREAHATGIVVSGHVKSENNYADIATKALPGNKLYSLCKPLLFKPHQFQGSKSVKLISDSSDIKDVTSTSCHAKVNAIVRK